MPGRGVRTAVVTAIVAGGLAATLTTTVSGGHSSKLSGAQPATFSFDNTFGRAGATVVPGSNGGTGAAVVPSGVANAGAIMVAGTDKTHFQVARFTSSGALDLS